MKRVLLPSIIVLVSLVSCSKYDGTDYYSPRPTYTSTPLQEYLMSISNDLAAGALAELESALRLDQDGSLAQYFYGTNGKALSEDGSVWTISREGDFKGAKISKVAGETAWVIDFDGEFEFTYCKYPTSFRLKASAADANAIGHRDWNVDLSGKRTEDDGYYCTFDSIESPIQYTAVDTEGSKWNAFGYLKIEVMKDETKVDALIMELRGGISSISITHI